MGVDASGPRPLASSGKCGAWLAGGGWDFECEVLWDGVDEGGGEMDEWGRCMPSCSRAGRVRSKRSIAFEM